MSLPGYLLRIWPLLLALLCSGASAATLALDAYPERIDLSGSLSLLHDPAGKLHYTEVLAMGDAFREAQPADLVRGFNAGVFWLRVSLVHTGAQPITRWLAVGTAKINLVTLYLRSGNDWQAMYSGRSVALAQKPVVATDAVFPVTLAPGENRELLIRVVARGATDMSCILWEPQAYRFASGESRLWLVAILAGILISGWLALLAFIRLRQTRYLWLSLLLIAIAGLESARQNFIGVYLWPHDMAVPLQMLSLFAGLALFALARVLSFALDLPRQLPRAETLLRILRWIAAGAVCVSFFDYGLGARLLAVAAVCVHLAGLTLPLVLWRRGYAPARWFAAAFSLGLLLETARQLANLGILPWAKAMDFSLAGYLLSAPFILIGMVEQTRKLSQQLAVAEQLQQAKSAFLARVSHELRSPLNTILGFSRMLRRGSARLSLAEGAAGIEKGAIRLLGLIDELLDEARVAAGKLSVSPVPTPFVSWLEEVVAGAEVSCEAQGNRFVCVRSAELPPAVLLDGLRLRQVLENLLSNANRHTRHGEIQLECKASLRDATALLEFVVRDDGEGITPEQIKVIFEPFVRGPENGQGDRRRRSGFGLGLPICRELIRQMGSDIAVSSDPGKGSCFRFTLHCPLLAPEEVSGVEHNAFSVSARPLVSLSDLGCLPVVASSPRVLLVEDDPEHLALLRDQLGEAGFDTGVARNALAALEQVENSRWDAIITDQMMAEGDGWYLLCQIREFGLSMPVILLSAALPQRPPGFPAGVEFDAILRKPALSEDLLLTLWMLLLKIGSASPTPGGVTAGRWLELATLASDGDVSGIEDWLAGLDIRTEDDERLASWVRAALGRLDLGLLEHLARKAWGWLQVHNNCQ